MVACEFPVTFVISASLGMNNMVRNWLGAIGVCLVFLFGMIAGAALTIHIERVRTEQLVSSGRLRSTMVDRLTRRLTNQLNCDARQQDAIRDILQGAQREMRETRRQIAPKLRQNFFQATDRVRGVLHGDQLKTFDEIITRIHARQASMDGVSSTLPSSTELKTPEASPQLH